MASSSCGLGRAAWHRPPPWRTHGLCLAGLPPAWEAWGPGQPVQASACREAVHRPGGRWSRFCFWPGPPSFCNFWEPWGSWPLSLPTLKMGLLTSPRVSHGTELGSRWNASERVMSEKISEGSSVFCFHSSSNRGSEKFKNSPKVTQQGTGK